MTDCRSPLLVCTLLCVLGVAADAGAQTFPPESGWRQLSCGGGVSTDPVRDESGATGERDIIGDMANAALWIASDSTFLYLRMRLADSPARADGSYDPFGWGFEFDTNGDFGNYEAIVILDGIANPDEVALARNDVMGRIGDPSDVAETTVMTYPATTHAMVIMAASMLDGDPDFFVEVAIPLADLALVGVTPASAVVWAGTSSNARSLNADIACHDGTTGDPDLRMIPPGTITVPMPGDSDGDGVPDTVERPGGADRDTDADGTPDHLDIDDDGDGIPTVTERPGATDRDSDRDGRPDHLDPDDDGDGISTATERTAPEGSDVDMDGIPNHLDLDSDADGMSDMAEGTADADGDGIPNYLDPFVPPVDTDGDGIPDAVEGGPGTDTDMDGMPDFMDADDDGDGIPTAMERPGGVSVDTDGDGALDHLDPDDDGDMIPTSTERTAPEGSDVDMDGTPNDRDTDSDGDGALDLDEGTGDSDGDGTPDYLDPDGAPLDSDGDGLADDAERPGGVDRDTDGDGTPDHLDTDDDGDGIPTMVEAPGGTPRDTDGDGTPDHLDTDDDGDGIGTMVESTDPAGGDVDTDGTPNYLDLDSDGDGMSDMDEGTGDADADGVPNYLDPEAAPLDTDGDGVPDATEGGAETDTDMDGMPDFMDPDDDGDGVSTREERPGGTNRDSDMDGVPDYLDPDDDDDGVATIDERPGNMGRDTDDDGIEDHLDPDDDGDGVPTLAEGGGDDDGDTIPNWLDPVNDMRVPGGISGGAGCSATGGAPSGAWALLLVLGLALGRRRLRVGATALVLLLGAGSARAQQDAVTVDQYHPAEVQGEGFAVSRPIDQGRGRLSLGLHLEYANDPLVWESVQGDAGSEAEALVSDQLVAHLGVAFGLADRAVIFGRLPATLWMAGESPMGSAAPPADGTRLGDISGGARVRILGDGEHGFGLALQASAYLPSASLADDEQVWAGEDGLLVWPELLAEVASGRMHVTVNAGVRVRPDGEIADLSVRDELTWALGLGIPISEAVRAHVELFGATSLDDTFARPTTPVEGLVGVRWAGESGVTVGLGAGTGLTRGYGSPDARLVLTAGYAEPVPRAEVVEVLPEPPRPEPEPPPPPVDTDGDGLLDPVDTCPTEPEDRDDFEDEDGCPDRDDDRDGIEDPVDQCRLEPEDRDSFEDDNGCPDPDNDQDTVLDPSDQCPLAPGPADNNGCPRRIRLEASRIVVLENVEFATNRDVVLERSFPILEEVRATLAANPQLRRIRVEGHTDDRGRDARNLDLSQRRANSVMRWLTEHGIEQERLEAQGFGETRPIESNRTSAGRQRNRRVEFHIVDPAVPDGTTAEVPAP